MSTRPLVDSARWPAGFFLLIALMALAAGGKAILYDTMDPDCFWHLRVAEQLHHDGIGPVVDNLSFESSKRPWTPYSWLAELGMKALWDAGGYRAAVAAQALIQAGIAIMIALCCLEAQRQFKAGGKLRFFDAAIATFAGIFLTLGFLSFRPVTFALLLMWLCTWLILRDRRLGERSWALWLVVPLAALLTNIHLYAIFMPAVIFLLLSGAIVELLIQRANPLSPVHGGEGQGEGPLEQQINLTEPNPIPLSQNQLQESQRRANRYGVLLIIVTLACLATPMLPGAIKTALFYNSHDEMVRNGGISEMGSFFAGPFGIASTVILCIMLACLIWRHRRLRAADLFCFLAGAALLLKFARFSPVFAMAAIPLFAATLPDLRDLVLQKRPVIILLLVIDVVGLGRLVWRFPRPGQTFSAWLDRHGSDTPGYPCAAADFVEQHVPRSTGKLINEFNWGGYLAWRLAGQYQILLDGRTQVYPPQLWQATYLGDEAAREQFLTTLTADVAVLPKEKSRFRPGLAKLGWTTAFTDGRSEVMLPPTTRKTRED